jgi:hypothetical protein
MISIGLRPLLALGALAAVSLAGCGGGDRVALRGGQTPSGLAEDRRQCIAFVRANPQTTPELAEAACLIARGYRAPLPLTQGPTTVGTVQATAQREANAMVLEFQGCHAEAFSTPMPVNPDKKSSGIFTSLYEEQFPRGMLFKARTPDEWALQTFAACLKRLGYTVSDVTPTAR